MLAMGTLEQEEVRTMLLDTRNRVLASPMIYRGSLNTTSMRIGEVFKEAIRAKLRRSDGTVLTNFTFSWTGDASDSRIWAVVSDAGGVTAQREIHPLEALRSE